MVSTSKTSTTKLSNATLKDVNDKLENCRGVVANMEQLRIQVEEATAEIKQDTSTISEKKEQIELIIVLVNSFMKHNNELLKYLKETAEKYKDASFFESLLSHLKKYFNIAKYNVGIGVGAVASIAGAGLAIGAGAVVACHLSPLAPLVLGTELLAVVGSLLCVGVVAVVSGCIGGVISKVKQQNKQNHLDKKKSVIQENVDMMANDIENMKGSTTTLETIVGKLRVVQNHIDEYQTPEKFRKIITLLEELNYELQTRVVDAKNLVQTHEDKLKTLTPLLIPTPDQSNPHGLKEVETLTFH